MAGDVDSSSGRIVVGLDGSESALEALRWAGRIGVAIGVNIDVVACWEHPQVGSDDLPAPTYRNGSQTRQVAAKWVDEVFGGARPEGLRLLVRQGEPERVLTQAATGAEMLVVGSRGRGAFASIVLGSVSIYCAEHARCPVVIIHG